MRRLTEKIRVAGRIKLVWERNKPMKNQTISEVMSHIRKEGWKRKIREMTPAEHAAHLVEMRRRASKGGSAKRKVGQEIQ